MMVANPKTLISSPAHRARAAGGKMSPRMAWTMGSMAPAPRPCTPRKPINSIMVRLWPHNAEPITKITMPRTKKRRLPNASDSLPQMGIEAAEASR